MAWTKEFKQLVEDTKQRLIELSVDEAAAVLQYDLYQRTEWFEGVDYIMLEKEVLRQRKNGRRTIIIGRKLEEPDKMAIFSDAAFWHHPETSQGHENKKRKEQIESLRRRINEHSGNKKTKFSSISG